MNRSVILCFVLLLIFVSNSCCRLCREEAVKEEAIFDEEDYYEEYVEEYGEGDMDMGGIADLPPLVIYRTRADYRNLVPVILNDEKTEILSFPGPADVYFQGELAIPVELSEGYLLDLNGIGPRVAFLNITYEDYAALDTVITARELFSMIMDDDPLTEMYVCGSRFGKEQDISEAERIIGDGSFFDCIKLK